MIIINIAEWCVEALLLGITFLAVAMGVFIFLMLFNVIKRWFKTGDNNG